MTNDTLSTYRAMDIVNYLKLNGIEAKRLTSKGYGSRSSFQLTEDIKIKGSIFKKGTVLTECVIQRAQGNKEIFEHLNSLNQRAVMKIIGTADGKTIFDLSPNRMDSSFFQIPPFSYITEYVIENPAPYSEKYSNNESKQRKNAFVPKNHVIKRSKSEEKWVVLFEDNAYNRIVCGTGYWVAISYNKGQDWNYYYTGITENYPYVFKQNSQLPLMKNDSILEIECIKVFHQVLNWLPPFHKTTLVKDSVYISINLNEIMKDTDNDGITDVVENRFLLNPNNVDTDGDGIPDGIDGNPRFKSRKTETGMIYQLLLEHDFNEKVNINKYCFDCNHIKPYSSSNYPTNISVMESNNPDEQQLNSQFERIIIVDSTENQDMIRRNIYNNMTYIYPDNEQDNNPNISFFHLRYGDTLFYYYRLTKHKNIWKFKLLNFYLV